MTILQGVAEVIVVVADEEMIEVEEGEMKEVEVVVKEATVEVGAEVEVEGVTGLSLRTSPLMKG